MSEIRLRNATLISAPDTCALDTAAVKAVRAVAFANALDGEGLAERAAYAQVRRHVAPWHVARLGTGAAGHAYGILSADLDRVLWATHAHVEAHRETFIYGSKWLLAHG